MKNISRHRWYEWQDAPTADFAVIGDPISHSLSPLMHNKVLRHLGLPQVYHAIRVSSADFSKALAHLNSLGYLGLNITAPLKEKAYQWVVNKNTQITAYNTLNLKTGEGINTDLPGFYQTLVHKKWDKPCSILFLGGGATTKSLAFLLINKGFDVHIFARDLHKIDKWVIDHKMPITLQSEIKNLPIQLIVNTLTPAQILDYIPHLMQFTSFTRFYDLNYSSCLDPLYLSLQKRFDYINGLNLLVEQGALSLEWWLKCSVPKHIMLEAVGLDRTP